MINRQPSVTATMLRYLATASKHRTMYPSAHPIVRRAMEDLVQVTDLLLRDREAVTFQIYEDTFFLDNVMLPEEMDAMADGMTVGHRAARNGRDPRTGKAIRIPECQVPRFKASRGLKAALK